MLALACARGGDAARAAGGDSASLEASAASGSTSPLAAAKHGVVSSPGGKSAPGRRRTILFVGTSLTAGYGLDPDSAYPQQIQRMIDSAGLPYDVVNAGVSGETSSSLLARLDWLLRQPFDVIVIETGANDGLRGVPVDAMARNVERIVERVRSARPEARVLLARMEAPPNLGATYTRAFRDVFPKVAQRTGVSLMPFLLEGVAGVASLNQADGMHPNYAGERIVARNVWGALRPLLQ